MCLRRSSARLHKTFQNYESRNGGGMHTVVCTSTGSRHDEHVAGTQENGNWLRVARRAADEEDGGTA